MPTFKLEDLGDDETFGGDNDMYFRQWRQPSMKPVLNEKLDRDFRASMEAKENFCKNRAERKKRHDEKFEKRMTELTNKLSQATVNPVKSEPFLPPPSESDLKIRRELWDREFETPSSTAVMTQAKQLPVPRKMPIFGKNMAGLKNIVLPPASTPLLGANENRKPTISESSTPKDNSFLNNSHETVFYPQTHSSFNLDHYNGNRPSFAFAGLQGATSTPVGKTVSRNFAGIAEEADDSVFDNSRYVTALESPVFSVKAKEAETARLQKEREEKEQAAENVRLQRERELKEAAEKEAAERARREQRLKELEDAAKERKEKLEAAQRDRREKEELAAENGRLQKDLKDAQRAKEEQEPKPTKPPTRQGATRIHDYLRNFVNLYATLIEEKNTFEKSSDPQSRMLLKRTINERVTVFTQRDSTTEKRAEILEFFRRLLGKREVDGFAVLGEPPKLALNSDQEIAYAVYCIVEQYLSLASHDEDLTNTIAELMSRLSLYVRRAEKVFLIMMLNKSALVCQNPQRCEAELVKKLPKDPDSKALIINRENALLSLFFCVFGKNAYCATKGTKALLNIDLLWKFADATVDYATELPKSVMILLQMIMHCEKVLKASPERFKTMISRIAEEIIPALELEAIKDDDGFVRLLKLKISELID